MATAAVQNLIREAHANVHACVRHNVISPFESMTLFLFYALIAFSECGWQDVLSNHIILRPPHPPSITPPPEKSLECPDS